MVDIITPLVFNFKVTINLKIPVQPLADCLSVFHWF